MRTKGTIYGIILLLLILALTGANLLFGSVNIPADAVWHILTGNEVEKASWSFIVWESRLPQAVTALLCGMALASSGLMLQTTFNNPLAGFISVIIGAFIGSMLVMGIILFFSTLIKNSIMLLIIGIMIGYITSSAISLLNFFSTAEGVHSYMIWGMGNFGGVSLQQLPFFSLVTATGLLITILLIKPLNALLLGTRYAENLGINIRRTRNLLLIATGILTAITTAFCGPISFIGLAVPHIARLMLGTSNHNSLLPVTMLTGGVIALVCNFICILPGEAGIIPLNAVTPVIGAPIIIYVIVNQRKIQYFN